jgi:hypothetical protein
MRRGRKCDNAGQLAADTGSFAFTATESQKSDAVTTRSLASARALLKLSGGILRHDFSLSYVLHWDYFRQKKSQLQRLLRCRARTVPVPSILP